MNARQPRAQMLRQIGYLPERYREVWWLHYVEGLSYITIARLFQRPVGTIKCWISRSNNRLLWLLKNKRSCRIPCRGDKDGGLSHLSPTELAGCIARLPKSYRVYMQMHYLQGYSYSAIARTLGQPVGTVKNRIYRAKKMLFDG